MRYKHALLITVLLIWQGLAFAKISLQIDPPQVQVDETFRLVFTVDHQPDSMIPDLTPLQRDFTIIGTERSMSYSIVNGQAHSVNQWVVLLTAKKPGTFTIPALKFGQQESTASKIEVSGEKVASNPDDDATTPQEAVMLKTEVSQRDPYVNQQVIYTVKLFNSQRLLDAEFQPPQVEDALLIPLGTGNRYQTTVNGRDYLVEEQRYAISPQKSGELKITAPTFKALVYVDMPRRVSIHPKSIKLNVKPIPADFKGKHWLPSKQVSLTETYEKADATMTEGSTLVRTIALEANGIPAQLLPTLEFANNPQFNTYKEKPDLQNKAKNHELVGIETVKVTYLLNKTGQITIPAVNMPWFNSTTGKEEVATLPERTVEVTAKAGALQPAAKPSIPAVTKKEVAAPSKSTPQNKIIHTNLLAWWIAGAFALAWLITLGLWWARRGSLSKRHNKRLALKRIQAACANNDAHQAQIALLQWAKTQWPDRELLNLHQLANLVQDVAMKKELMHLSEVLYSQKKKKQWHGDALWQCVTSCLHIKPTSLRKEAKLPPINPD